MIELKNVCKKFGDHVIFENYNLEIDDGEFIVLSGDSGCGKTTLLNIIGGLEKPDDGQVLVNGLDVYNKKNQLELYRHVYGFCFKTSD